MTCLMKLKTRSTRSWRTTTLPGSRRASCSTSSWPLSTHTPATRCAVRGAPVPCDGRQQEGGYVCLPPVAMPPGHADACGVVRSQSSTLPSVREAAEAVAGRNGGKPAVTGATSSSGAGVGAGAGSGAGAGAGAGASPAAVPAVSPEAGDGSNTAEAPATVAVTPPQPPDAPVASASNAPALPRQVTPQDTAKPEESSASAADNGEPGEGAAE